ncbi:MAG: sulfite exporter TauE/SafE family protein [Oscillospiraceae bacterium]|nr:sulfite exporter TauE/SafE family protein [Oscillospiraceae bacterium]
MLLIFLINFGSAFIQGATGFGYALVAMAIMPLFLPMSECSAISAVTVVAIGLQMTITLRKNLKLKVILLPVLCCFMTINLGLYLLNTFDELLLRVILAVLLLLVTGIFLIMRRKSITLPNRWYSAAGAGLLTGVSTGLFNIVGPFLMVYYINVCQTTFELKASLEFSFLLAGLYSAFMHTYVYHNINLSVLPELTASVVAVLLAGFLGLKLFRRIDKDKMALLIYILLPVMAIILIIKGLA